MKYKSPGYLREGIAYRYEHPLVVVDHGKTRIWYPDFFLPGYGMIVEYFGVNRDPGNDERTRHKIETYRQNGIDDLFLTEDSLKGDWPSRIMDQIKDVLEQRVERFHRRSVLTCNSCQ